MASNQSLTENVAPTISTNQRLPAALRIDVTSGTPWGWETPVTWSVENTAIARIEPDPANANNSAMCIVVPLAAGTTRIYATCDINIDGRRERVEVCGVLTVTNYVLTPNGGTERGFTASIVWGTPAVDHDRVPEIGVGFTRPGMGVIEPGPDRTAPQRPGDDAGPTGEALAASMAGQPPPAPQRPGTTG